MFLGVASLTLCVFDVVYSFLFQNSLRRCKVVWLFVSISFCCVTLFDGFGFFFLALYLDFAPECKSLSVGELMSQYFPLFTCLSITILISNLCLTPYYFLKFTVWVSLTRNS